MGWSSSWWLGTSLIVCGSQFGKGAICRQFWWEVASSLFCASKPLFWLVGWWRDNIWCGGKPICGGAPSIADSRWRWPPAHCVLPARQVWWGLFSGCRQCCFWQCRQGCFVAVSPGLFLAVSPGLFCDCVARVVSGCVARVVSGWVTRVVAGCIARFVLYECCQELR